eukprot:3710336-Rhodomonas_salina.2
MERTSRISTRALESSAGTVQSLPHRSRTFRSSLLLVYYLYQLKQWAAPGHNFAQFIADPSLSLFRDHPVQNVWGEKQTHGPDPVLRGAGTPFTTRNRVKFVPVFTVFSSRQISN